MIVDWDKRIIDLFSDFADEELQRRSWFGIGPECTSPVEMCNWIDDVFLEEWLGEQGKYISRNLHKFIEDFIKDIEDLSDFTDDLFVFSSVKWMSIRLKASVIRDLLKVYINKKNTPIEK